jgi:hypothetical protein
MALSNNWGSYGRKQKAISSRNSPLGNVPLKAVFESLLFYAENPEKKSGNWVIVPHNWKELSEFDLHQFRVAHHQKVCATAQVSYDSELGDLLFRVRNEVVEMLEINWCSICRFA